MRWLTIAAIVAVVGLPPLGAKGAPKECDALQRAQQRLAAQILGSQHPYACCDKTLAECLKRSPACRLVQRLAAAVCRRVKAGQDRAKIERALARRATSMLPSAHRYSFDLSHSPAAGDPASKVELIAYACPRCPYCAHLVRGLYAAVTKGALKGKAKLRIRVFPLRSHPGSTEAAMALMAAQKLGKFWPLLLGIYERIDRYDPKALPAQAENLGLDRQRFTALSKDKALRSSLVASKKEGVRHKVEATPTLFINGRRYVGDLDLATVIDVLEEEADRLSGR
jgi:protein-disulfide isomerase